MSELILQETFPGAADDPWDTGRWEKDHVGGSAEDVQDGAGNGSLEYGLGNPVVARVRAKHTAVSLHRVEIDGLIYSGNTGFNRIFLLASNDWADDLEPTSGYCVFISSSAFSASLRRIDAGDHTELAAFNRHGGNGTPGSAFNLIFEVEDDGGQRVRVKTWLTTDPEPGSWDADEADDTYTSGVYQESWERNSAQRSATRTEMRIYDLAVAAGTPADVDGAVAASRSQAVAGTATAGTVIPATVQGATAQARSHAVPGSVAGAATVEGRPAQARSEGIAGSVEATVVVASEGPAVSRSQAVAGTVTTGATVIPATVTGAVAQSRSQAVSGTATGSVSVEGRATSSRSQAVPGAAVTGVVIPATVQGAAAVSRTQAVPGAVTVGVVIPATIDGLAAVARSQALAGLVTAEAVLTGATGQSRSLAVGGIAAEVVHTDAIRITAVHGLARQATPQVVGPGRYRETVGPAN